MHTDAALQWLLVRALEHTRTFRLLRLCLLLEGRSLPLCLVTTTQPPPTAGRTGSSRDLSARNRRRSSLTSKGRRGSTSQASTTDPSATTSSASSTTSSAASAALSGGGRVSSHGNSLAVEAGSEAGQSEQAGGHAGPSLGE